MVYYELRCMLCTSGGGILNPVQYELIFGPKDIKLKYNIMESTYKVFNMFINVECSPHFAETLKF